MFIRVEHDSRSEHLNKYLDLGYPWVGMLNNMGENFYSFKNLSFLCLVAFRLEMRMARVFCTCLLIWHAQFRER